MKSTENETLQVALFTIPVSNNTQLLNKNINPRMKPLLRTNRIWMAWREPKGSSYMESPGKCNKFLSAGAAPLKKRKINLSSSEFLMCVWAVPQKILSIPVRTDCMYLRNISMFVLFLSVGQLNQRSINYLLNTE